MPPHFTDDSLVNDFWRPDGTNVTANFEWGHYNGHFLGGRANGFGVQMIRRRPMPGGLPSEEYSIYRGEWKEGKREGVGRVEIPWENRTYEGGWKEGKPHGWGKSFLSRTDGWPIEMEECGYREGRQHGWGLVNITREKGESSWITGGFKEGERYGMVLKMCAGVETLSSIKAGIVHGYQTTKRDGIVQTREFFLDGQRASQPTNALPARWFPEAISFESMGATYDTQSNGIDAVARATNGDVYRGNLQWGAPHGCGKLEVGMSGGRFMTGTYDGGFKRGYAWGFGVWVGRDNIMYAGGWSAGKPQGYGRITFEGDTFEAFFEDGAGWTVEPLWRLVRQANPPWLAPAPIPTERPVTAPYPFPFPIPTPTPLPRSWDV